MQEIEVSLSQDTQDIGVEVSQPTQTAIGVEIAGEQIGLEVIHDNTLKGKGQRSAPLGVADSVLENIDSKVSDVKVNGETVVEDTVADITIGDATITIQKNGQDVDSFTANATENKSINIVVPTKTSDITNDSDYQNSTEVDGAIAIHNTSNDAHSNLLSPISQRITDNADAILAETNRATLAESGLQSQITTNANNITTINGKIPEQATSSNQLADKNFVNSSISTNTANFIGTFNSVAELEAYSGTVTNNDYAFVVGVDSAGNTVYNRYKYTIATTPASWVFEYALNNSSFTADQWTAINSGATPTNIGQITTNKNTMDAHIANKNNPHEVTKTQVGLGNCDNTSDLNKPVSTAQQTALDGKVDKTTTANQVYTTDGNGNQAHYLLSVNALANSFAYRNADAQVRVATTPSGNNDATSKKYVDDNLATKQGTLTAGTNIQINNDTISATDTTYTGSDGITLTGTNFTNSGVRAVETGTANGTISVNTNGTSADVAVKGLGSAAYTASTDYDASGSASTAETNAKNYADGLASNYATAAQGALADTAVQPSDLATVATTGDYDDLLNKPTIPAAQVNSDWNANSGVAEILNKPTTLSGYGITDGANTDLSNLTATGEARFTAKANTDLDNLTATGANIANWSSNVTNCITEIPQDIKLELNNGTLTLKAGSKVYVPNGADRFDEYEIPSDISVPSVDGILVFLNQTKTAVAGALITNCYSGSTQPTGSQGVAWYDTTNNVVKYHDGSSWISGYSLPIGSVSSSGELQVFNGLGYIGSTVFALPNVKGLIPNGRNADGTLNNTVTNDFNTVKTVQVNTSTAKIAMYGSGGLGSQTKNFELNEQENFNYDTGVLTNAVLVANVIVDSNAKITAFIPKTVFHALDYSDKKTITSWGVPDYASVIAADSVASGTWTQCQYDSMVCVWAGDPYTENYYVYVSPDKSTKYIVGRRYDDTNAQTQVTSFYFFVPQGWWFQDIAEQTTSYRIYPLKGSK